MLSRQPSWSQRAAWGLALLGVALTTSVVAQSAPVCAIPGKDGSTFAGNTYYAGSGTATQNTTSLTLGAKRSDSSGTYTVSSTDVAAGDLILVMQMQDALIRNDNAASYGDGASGKGYVDLRSSGRYEFAVVSAVSGSTLTVRDPLKNTYTQAAADTLNGQRSFQVLRVPQFSSLTLAAGATYKTLPWNGSTGGVTVLNVAGTLNMNGAILDASSVGFRGGGAREDTAVGSNKGVVDYATPFSSTLGNRGAFKGEGIAGTPQYVRGSTATGGYTGVNLAASSQPYGYPTGSVQLFNADGSLAAATSGSLDRSRGAPGNAGGGGNQHNAGGGGGSNAGYGGQGGNSFGFYRNPASGTCVNFGGTFNGCDGDGSRAVGGLGGPAIAPGSSTLLMGGGGGAGDSNNAGDNPSIPQGSGGNGGGVILLVANTVTGSGTLRANGQDGEPGGRDAAGGGGAGGTIAISSSSSTLNLSTEARGGKGGNSGLVEGADGGKLGGLYGGEAQGPAGGGGGGAVLIPAGSTLSSTPALQGGASGVNIPVTGVSNAYGSASGEGKVGTISYTNTAVPLGSSCVPALNLTKSTDTPTVNKGGQALFTLTVSNAVGRGTAQGLSLSDPLPTGFTLASSPAPIIVVSGGASRTAASDPSSGATSPTWGSFVLPGGSSVRITFWADVSSGASPTAGSPVSNSFTTSHANPQGTGTLSSTSNAVAVQVNAAANLTCSNALYMGNGNNTTLFRFDPVASTVTAVSGITLTRSTAAVGLTPNASSLFWNTWDSNNTTTARRLYTYAPGSGTTVDLAPQPDDGGTPRAIQRNGVTQDNVGYYGGFSGGTNSFYRYNTATGAASSAMGITTQPTGAPTFGNGGDVAFDRYNVGYLIDNARNFYRLDFPTAPATTNVMATWLGTVTGLPAGNMSPAGLAFASDNRLYFVTVDLAAGVPNVNTGYKLYRLDLVTLAVTDVTPVSLPTEFRALDMASCFYPDLAPNLSAQKAVRNVTRPGEPAVAGDTLEYTVTVRNSGNIQSGGTTFQDTLISPLSYKAGSTSLNGSSVTDGAGGVFPYASATPINTQGLAAGTVRPDTVNGVTSNNAAVVRFQVTVNATSGSSVSNQGRVASVGMATLLTDDPGTTASGDPTLYPVGSADIAVTKLAQAFSSGGYFPVRARMNGQSFRYVLEARNAGTITVSGVKVNDTLPTQLTQTSAQFFLNGASSGTQTYSGGVWTVGTLRPEETARLELYVRLNTLTDAAGLPSQIDLPNTATLDSGVTDGVSSNNSQTATVLTNPVRLSKSVRNVTQGQARDDTRTSSSGKPQDLLEYCIKASNAFTGGAIPVSFVDVLEPRQTFQSGSATLNGSSTTVNFSGTTLSKSGVVVSAATLAGSTRTNGTAELCFQVKVD